jgi:sirohydrochlorin cobaltochelatase
MSNSTPVIVLVAFGASSAEARRVYRHIDETVRRHKPRHDVRWAFTSHKIAARLRSQGVALPTIEETVGELRRCGVRTAVLQPLLTVPGQEYTKLAELDYDGLKVAIGGPLLPDTDSTDEVIDALGDAFREDSVNVLVCHGNRRHPAYNSRLLELARKVEARHANVVVASVEGSPGDAPLLRARELARAGGAVRFVPFMLVAGEHVTNDVMGDHQESWKCRVGAARVSCAQSLGWSPKIVDIYLQRLDAALDRLEAMTR